MAHRIGRIGRWAAISARQRHSLQLQILYSEGRGLVAAVGLLAVYTVDRHVPAARRLLYPRGQHDSGRGKLEAVLSVRPPPLRCLVGPSPVGMVFIVSRSFTRLKLSSHRSKSCPERWH